MKDSSDVISEKKCDNTWEQEDHNFGGLLRAGDDEGDYKFSYATLFVLIIFISFVAATIYKIAN